MKSLTLKKVFFAALVFLNTSAFAASFNGWNWLEKTPYMKAHFEQRIFNKSNAPIGPVSIGQFWIQRPGRFRWEYQKPSEQLTVGDGQKVIWYDTQLKQVVIKSAKSSLNNALAQLLIAPSSSFKERFKFEPGENDQQYQLTVTPLHPDQEGFQSIVLHWAKKPAPMLQTISVLDGLNQHIEFTLSNVSTPATAFSNSLFQFTPPPGTTSVNENHE